MPTVRRVGIVGYGKLGQYLVSHILSDEAFELAFVWNRSKEACVDLDSKYVLEDLSQFMMYKPDLVVEVAHPCISKQYGALFLQVGIFAVSNKLADW